MMQLSGSLHHELNCKENSLMWKLTYQMVNNSLSKQSVLELIVPHDLQWMDSTISFYLVPSRGQVQGQAVFIPIVGENYSNETFYYWDQ